jgi:hypothetical protein
VQVVVDLDAAAAEERAAARAADVRGDRVEPGRLELRADAAAEGTERVQEGRLDGVLGLLAVSQLAQAEALERLRIALEERVQLGVLLPDRPDLDRIELWCLGAQRRPPGLPTAVCVLFPETATLGEVVAAACP